MLCWMYFEIPFTPSSPLVGAKTDASQPTALIHGSTTNECILTAVHQTFPLEITLLLRLIESTRLKRTVTNTLDTVQCCYNHSEKEKRVPGC